MSSNKIVIFSTDYFYSNIMVKLFLSKIDRKSVVLIVEPKKIYKSSNPLIALISLYQRIGPLYFASHLLRHGLYLLGKISAYIFKVPITYLYYPYRKIAKDIKVLEVESLNDPAVMEHLKDYKADIGVSLLCNQYFNKRLLESFRLGIIGFHPSKLPEYKGSNPIFWQMLQDEPHVGVSIFKLDVKIDCGETIMQDKIKIQRGDTENSLYIKACYLGVEMMVKTVNSMLRGESSIIMRQEDKTGSYFGIPCNNDVVKFMQKKRKLFKFSDMFYNYETASRSDDRK